MSWVRPAFTPGPAVVPVGQALETDTAFAVGVGEIAVAVNQTTETDTAQTFSVLRTFAFAQALETDTANSFTPSEFHTIGQALETDTAQLIDVLQQLLVRQVEETDNAREIQALIQPHGPGSGGSGGGADDFWSIDIEPADGGTPDLEDATFRKMRIVWTADGPGACEVDLRADDISDAWTPGIHRIIIRGPRDFAGDLTKLTRTGGPKEKQVGWKASGLGLAHRLDYRIVRHDLAVNDEAAVIVEALLSEAQDNQFNGDMGFQMGTVSGTTVSRSRAYCVGVNIGDAIRELASVRRGFDWEIDTEGNLNIWNRTRGIDTTYTLQESDTQSFEIELDTSELLTNVTTVADPSDPFGPKFRMVRTEKAITHGRREVAVDSDVIAHTDDNPDWEEELNDIGAGVLKTDGGGYLRVHTMWVSDRGPWNFGDVWLQDTVRVDLPDVFGGNTRMRCTDVTVTIEPMPPRDGDAPLYFIEYGFDALVTDLDVTDGDPDQEE